MVLAFYSHIDHNHLPHIEAVPIGHSVVSESTPAGP